MKKTTSINIGGIVLHIDEDAFEKLQAYIKSLEKHFEKDPEKAEILNDIELRIAELLCEELPDRNQSIKIDMVEKAVGIMGNPQEFDDDKTESKTEKTQSTNNNEEKKTKQLYRNPDGKLIAGVAGGLAVYFNIDPVIMRLLFIVFTFIAGFPIPLYIIMWLIVPEAQTRTQKMEMKGESINIDSIKKNAQAGFDDIKSSVRDFSQNKNTQHAASQIGSFIGKVGPVVFKIIFGLSIAAIITAIIVLFALEVSPQMVCWGIPPNVDPEVIYFLNNVDVSLLGIGFLLVASAAVTSIFYILPNVIWGQRSGSKVAGQVASALTTIGIIIIIIALTKSVVDYQALKELIFLGEK